MDRHCAAVQEFLLARAGQPPKVERPPHLRCPMLVRQVSPGAVEVLLQLQRMGLQARRHAIFARPASEGVAAPDPPPRTFFLCQGPGLDGSSLRLRMSSCSVIS